MMDVLKAEKRTAIGKSSLKKLRAEGFVPGIIYGMGKETTPVQLDVKTLESYFEQGGRMADLLLDGKKLKALIKEVQHDIFSDDILHVDFLLVSLTEKITLPVPVILTGELQFPPDQGSLEQIITEVEVECLPNDAPEEFKIDISGLEVGASLHVSDLEMPAGVTLVSAGEEAIATVRRPAAEEEEVPAEEGEEPQEPEVIGERKEEKESE